MEPLPPEPPVPGESVVADETLEALAAGEVGDAEAALLRARAARDPALAARLRAVERVEAALLAHEAVPLPLGLVAAVLDRLRGERTRGGQEPLREATASPRGWAAAAAALLLGLAGWQAWRSAPAVPPLVAGALPASVEGVLRDLDSWNPWDPRDSWDGGVDGWDGDVRRAAAGSVDLGVATGPLGVAAVVLGVGLAARSARGARGRASRTDPGAPCAS